MTDYPSPAPDVPDHIDEAVRSVTQLHSDHHGRATSSQRAVNRMTAFMTRPFFIALLGLGVTGAFLFDRLIACDLLLPPGRGGSRHSSPRPAGQSRRGLE